MATYKYIFILGNTSELCLAELQSVLSTIDNKYRLLDQCFPAVMIETSVELDTVSLLQRLGGTVKIGQYLTETETLTVTELAKLIQKHLPAKAVFGLSFYGQEKYFNLSLTQFLGQIKTQLLNEVPQVRYVLPKENWALSSVVVSKQQVTEFLLIAVSSNKWLVGVTRGVQDFSMWTSRDINRPYIAAKAGMLPPKVARMLVNLVSSKFNDQSSKLLLDPFCGMGTILQEALLTGWQVVGSDNSQIAVAKAQKNLDWLSSNYPQVKNTPVRIFVSDATHVAEKIAPDSIDAIVTEPFMGVPFETRGSQILHKGHPVTVKSITNIIKGLEKLYLGALKEWHKILKPDAYVVIIFPEIHFGSEIFSVKKLIDRCENLGYTLVQDSYSYSRPQAIVRRKIYIFRKILSTNI